MKATQPVKRGRLRHAILNLQVLMILACAGVVCAADSPGGGSFGEGQKVEVREGDTWSAATILKREGRKFQVHYSGADASTDEWVAADRLRVPSGAAPGPATLPVAPRANVPPRRVFPNGQQVEAKWGGSWRKAVVVNHRGEWYLIDYDGNRFFREWVEPWRVRTAGSADDFPGFAKINPSVHHNEGPPRENPGPPPDAADSGKNSAPGEPAMDVPITACVRNDVKLVSLDAAAPALKLPPDINANVKPPAAGPISLKGCTDQFFDQARAMIVAPTAAMAAVMHVNAPPGKAPVVRLERIDLQTGRSLNVASLPVELEPLDLSPDGKLLAARTTVFGPGRGGRLDVWQVDGDKAAHVVTFMPCIAGAGSDRIEWARFLDADHLLVMGGSGEINCWEYRKATELWSAKGALSTAATLSSNAKYLAVATRNQICFIEPLRGQVLAAIDLRGQPAHCLSFKPDGTRLAVAGADSLAVYDLSTGAQTDDIVAVGTSGDQIDWMAEGYLLLDHGRLVSFSKHAVVWTYNGLGAGRNGPAAAGLSGRLYYLAGSVGQEKSAVVASVALPEPAVQAVLAAVGDMKMVLKPGMSVSLEVSIDGSIQQTVVDALTAKLTANGINIADNQPIRLTVKSEPGETREMSYRRMGPGAFGETDKRSIQQTKNTIAFVSKDDQVFWRRVGVTSPPFFLNMKAGQSIDDALAEQMKPSPGFFTNVRLPRFLPRNPDGFGASQLTAAGAEPAKAQPPLP